jgi:hypothetical protein
MAKSKNHLEMKSTSCSPVQFAHWGETGQANAD